MKYFITLSSMLIIHFSLIRSNGNVIEAAASNKHALIVGAQTLNHIQLDAKNMEAYAQHFFEHSGKVLDTVMFAELINNAASVDTAIWQNNDFKNQIVVNGREDKISNDYLVEKLKLSGKKQIRYYTRFANKYNETNATDKNIYYFSKPAFSNSGKFAVIQWNNSHGNSDGGAGISLYQLDGDVWQEVGEISSWKN